MRRYLAIVLCALLLIPPIAAQTGETPNVASGDYEYNLNEDGTAIIRKYLGHAEQVTVPTSLGGVAVTVIGIESFYNNSELVGITIPEGVRVIEETAFGMCQKLTSVTLPASLETLGDRAFGSCRALTTFAIPAGLVGIGYGAFEYCENLTEFTVSPDNTSYRALEGVLFDVRTNTVVCYPCAKSGTDYTIPEGMVNIGPNAFNYALNLTRVTLPASMTEIGKYAFHNAENLAAIELPDRITKIGGYAFYGCKGLREMNIPQGVADIGDFSFIGCDSLTDILVSPNNPVYASLDGILFDKAMTTMLACPGGMSNERMKIPSGVSIIGEGAFGHCYLLVHIEIPMGISSIGGFAFDGCSNLEQISIPDSVENIEQCAFRYCYKLTDIRLPAALKEIDYALFERCESLKSIDLPYSLTAIRQSAFQGCTSLDALVIPGSVTEIEYAVFKGCTSLTTLSIPESVSMIEETAFEGCDSLVLQVREGSYAEQYAIENSIPYTLLTDSLQTPLPIEVLPSPAPVMEETPAPAGEYEYTLNEDGSAVITRYLGSAERLDIPGQLDGHPVTQIGANAFNGNGSLQYISIPDGVRIIGDYAFSACEILKEIRIPESVTSIGEWAFSLDPNLSIVSIPSGIKSISKGTFHYCTALEDIAIPVGVTDIGVSAFAGCSMRRIIVPDGVVSIAEEAFSSCGALTSVSIPASVTTIGQGAFAYSHYITEIAVAAGNPIYEVRDGVLFDKAQNMLHTYPAGMDRGDYEVPQGTKMIAMLAFSTGSKLKSITLPDSISDIGRYAFYSCGLKHVTLPPYVTSIEEGLFAYCSDLESVKVPAGVSHIGDGAFVSCDKLTLEVEESSLAHLYAAENQLPFRLASDGAETVVVETAAPAAETTLEPAMIVTSRPTETAIAENTVPPKPWPVENIAKYDLRAVDKGDERAIAWCGPGKNYREAGGFKTNKLSRVSGVFIEGDYVLVDMDYAGVGKRWVYFRKNTFKNTSIVPQKDLIGYGMVTVTDTMLRYGPGVDYDDFDDEYLPGGTQISVFFEENGWVFAEFMTSEGLTRGWVEADTVQSSET